MESPRKEMTTVFAELRGERDWAWTGETLWVAGRLAELARPCVAIVGTRAATAYGRRLAERFARELGASGCTIVSGLALGIDAAAHEGALAVGAPTIGVIGSGHARFFPRRNLPLAERILADGGAVISPYPPEQQAYPNQFLERNGVVAALADAVVVIEAPQRSGALNTANWAAGRIPVFAVPGDVDRMHVQGCLALIRDGAILARHAGDVLEVLHLDGAAAPQTAASRVERDGLAGALLRELQRGDADLDTLAAASGANAASVLATLALLECEGLIERSGARFCHAAPAHRGR